jgi:predicted 2-oxoglutarate/Fe(II)-dependent dioxygenase YbiX
MGLALGTPAPLFIAPSPTNPKFAFGSLGGRYVLLALLPGPGPEREGALELVRANLRFFGDDRLLFFGVLPDRESFAAVRDDPPCRWFLDADGELRRLYAAQDAGGELAPRWVLIDPMMRIIGIAPLADGETMLSHVARLGDPDAHAGTPLHAPVLIVPRIFEPDLCRRLIAYYREAGGTPSGVMRVRDGRTVGVLDDFKRRRDAPVRDPALVKQTRARISQRLLPEIEKAFQFKATRMERYVVACYDAEEGGYFNPHRDNTTPGTAHRRFAVSINLNAGEFEGGDLRFPEFGRRTYRPPTGGAVVFSSALLHEATPVTRGTRFAFLPFLYDEAAAQIRARNAGTFETAPAPAADRLSEADS